RGPAMPTRRRCGGRLGVPADPENVCRADRSMLGSDVASHGAHDGAAFGSFIASGMKAVTPAAKTDTASPQCTLYGACPSAGRPVTVRKTRAAHRRCIRGSDRDGRPTTYACSGGRADGAH